MIQEIYRNFILKYPIKTFFLLLSVILCLGFYATKLEIDASSNTILLENDSDLIYTQKVAKNFQTQDILVVAFTPKAELLSQFTINTIEKMSSELLALEKVKSITSILNVPLLQSSKKSIKDLIGNIPTLKDNYKNLDLVKKEFLTSPVFKNNLVSMDFKTTAIVVNLNDDIKISKNDKDFKKLRDEQRALNHIFIQNIRDIIKKYKNDGNLFLGGVNMISDDLITFVKSDLMVFGSSLLLLLIIVLWFIFREIRWIVIPILICTASIICTAGMLGFFEWEVTVISSNFISLQLIITISIVLHLIVRYRELVQTEPSLSQEELILETVQSKLTPSFFAVLTTIVGFASLLFSNILPIINLGWMMSSGIAISLIISFILFPIILVKLPISKPYTTLEQRFTPTKFLAKSVEFHGKTILFISGLMLLFSLSGATKLIVENSFINYFRPSTEIYQGMQAIDENLGGTTPLDVIVDFKKVKNAKRDSSDVDFDTFEEEFEEEKNENQYWFTPSKMQLIMKVHDYLDGKKEIGNVQSLATTLKIGKTLNEDKDLDSFQLALLYNKLPSDFQKILLAPYVNIEKNSVRFATRIVDSNPDLRRDILIKELNKDLAKIINPKEASFRLSNLMVLYNNLLQSLFKSQILTLGLVMALLFMMFLLIFKSIKIASIAIISNIIPMGVIFGFMGWFNIPLDLMTITIAAISLGIGVDDTIHYIHRFKKEFKKDQNYVKTMHRSHNSIGYAMYYTSFAIMLGFSVLVLSNFTPTIYFGFLTVIAMLMALLGALLLLPKLLIIFGERTKGKFL